MTAYLGGKHRQGPAIAQAVAGLRAQRTLYVEPFHGMMGSASAVAKLCPDMELELSDANPYVARMWEALLIEGWEPPDEVTLADYRAYQSRWRQRDPDLLTDPLTAYIGFGYSFAGRFFAAPARRERGSTELRASPKPQTLRKRDALLAASGISQGCRDYREAQPSGAVIYLDPPYFGTTPQTPGMRVVEDEFFAYCEGIARADRDNVVLVSAFELYEGCETVHEWGMTVSTHHNTRRAYDERTENEILMRVLPT